MPVDSENQLYLKTIVQINHKAQKVLTNVQLQKAIQKCITIEMSVLFGLFYQPMSKECDFQKTKFVITFTSQMFIFQDFKTWFEQKRSKLQETWKNWSGQISYADLYFVGRYQDPDLQNLRDLNMCVDIQIYQTSNFVKKDCLKEISLREHKISFISQRSQERRLISPHFVLKSYTVQSTTPEHQNFNLHVLTEKNSLWLDNLIRLDINFQLPISKMMYQSFNLLHFLEHCLLSFNQKEVQQLNIKAPNGATHAYGGMCLSIILPIERLEEFKDKFIKRQKQLYSKLEADRIVQEMYQVVDYQSCLLGGLGFLHNNDLLKTSIDWNNILYDLYSQLDVVDSFVQISCNCELSVSKILETVKQITHIPSPREKFIQKYFQGFGKFNTLPIFKYDTIIRLKKSVLKAEQVKFVQYILAQDKRYIYMVRQQFEDMDRQQEMDTEHIFNPFQRFFDFSALQQQWVQINQDTIEQMQYEQKIKQ